MVIYLDVLLAINGIVDYILLRAAAKLTGHPRNRLRILLGATLGAVYAAAVCLPGLAWLGRWGLKLAVGVGMGVIVFGWNRRCISKTLMFFLLAALFGGVVFALSQISGGALQLHHGAVYAEVSLPLLAAAVGGVYLMLTWIASATVRRQQTARQTVAVRVGLCGRENAFSALVDTGCLITDPLTSRPVMVAAADVLASLLPQQLLADWHNGRDPIDLIAAYSGGALHLRPIFCRGVGGGEEILPAFQPTELTVDGHDSSAIVALSLHGFDGESAFSAVIHADAV